MKTVRLSLTVLVALVSSLLATNCSKADRRFDTQVDVSAVIQQLQSPDEQERVEACRKLGAAGPHAAEAVPALIRTLADSSTLVQSLAAYALGQVGPPAAPALPHLASLIASNDPEVSRAALSAIRQIEPSAAP